MFGGYRGLGLNIFGEVGSMTSVAIDEDFVRSLNLGDCGMQGSFGL